MIKKAGADRAFFASLSGTSLEWYDFAVYNVASALLFGQLFFPPGDADVQTLSAFATYAVGYISRPIGGIVFGRMGDLIGRKKVLIATLLLVGVTTTLIGVLPTYADAGLIAPAMLIILRFAQGVGVGGEWGGAVLLSSEFASSEERGFRASSAQMGPPVGTLLANGVLGLLAGIMPEAEFLDWGWRIAFLLSALLVIFGLWARSRIEETPVFLALAKQDAVSHSPIREVLSRQPRQLVSSILSRVGPDIVYSLFTVYVLLFAVEAIGLERSQATGAVLIGSAVQVFAIPFAGWASDRAGRRTIYAIGAAGGAIAGLLVFLFATSFVSLVACTVTGLFFHSLMYGPQAAFISEQFEARLRYTGSSLAYTLAGPISGGIAPLAFALLLGQFGTPLAISAFVAFACFVTLIGLALSKPMPLPIEESLA